MNVAIVTGSGGLIGSEAVKYFSGEFDLVVGLDNDMRAVFFGPEASTAWNSRKLCEEFPNYRHCEIDIRDDAAVQRVMAEYGKDISVIIHAAAQPSHDWAASDPVTDFTVNANGTLVLLEALRRHCPEAVFIFTSTNKVYGDRPNTLPLRELETRWEIDEAHPYHAHGIDESMSVDGCTHSLFGVSKLAADALVQEYGRYFGIRCAIFRGGCMTGPSQSGAQLHGFLAYLMKCTVTGAPYTVFGYRGKQVRDNIHSVDLITAFDAFFRSPRVAEVYNIGGGRFANCSMLEAIALCEEIAARKLNWTYSDDNRIGDHIWWIGDIRKFQSHFPEWRLTYDIRRMLEDIHANNFERWHAEAA